MHKNHTHIINTKNDINCVAYVFVGFLVNIKSCRWMSSSPDSNRFQISIRK